MKTIHAAHTRTGIPERLIRAVIWQTGKESLRDIMEHGAAGGFPGLSYYADTVAFYKRHRAAIVELAKRLADDIGQPLTEMIASFHCLKGSGPAENDMLDAIGRTVYGRIAADDHDAHLVANALAWFAAEEVARAMCDE